MKTLLLSCAYLSVFLLASSNGQTTLQGYNVDRSKITTSGISSGGVMASQFHFAHSTIVSGAGIFASVPYMCGYGGVAASLTCMQTPNLVNVNFLISEANLVAAAGNIDATSNVNGDRVFIYHGQNDNIVYPASAENVKQFYEHYGAQVKTKFDSQGHHGQPTTNYGSACGSSAANTAWITNCNYDGAFEMFDFLYGGGLNRPDPSTVAAGDLILFDQSDFFTFAPSLSSMDTKGYVYIPSGCKDRTKACALHIAFHGCTQNLDSVGDAYVTKGGYLEAAELNNIIVLFPQTVATGVNPQGCWDWWGYLNPLFRELNNKPKASECFSRGETYEISCFPYFRIFECPS